MPSFEASFGTERMATHRSLLSRRRTDVRSSFGVRFHFTTLSMTCILDP